MLDNHLYNLMNQLVEEHKSLWRIKNKYVADAGNCAQCNEMWGRLIQDKEDHINELLGIIKEEVK
jgi:hypothetical protein